ncbi:hypothetical protein BDV24DRAFT_82114 [Aspergillus arachidicola]|uniref:Uncharacterized protein n=1 Tax=Aspergillus arachidicola TaxID=656916 RepID=A0A5N6Y1D7_9EURO|nr:hypothetical protein BDV24DRAFT_82114 [Aspergillus arachidicola]
MLCSNRILSLYFYLHTQFRVALVTYSLSFFLLLLSFLPLLVLCVMLSLVVYVLFRATMNMNMEYTPARFNGDIHIIC